MAGSLRPLPKAQRSAGKALTFDNHRCFFPKNKIEVVDKHLNANQADVASSPSLAQKSGEHMQELSLGQFGLVYNMLSFASASMLGSFVFFILARSQVSFRFRPALVMSALVVGIAGYHYLRIFNSWDGAFEINEAGTAYVATGKPFNDAYRYVDWLLTVPLLVAELIAVMTLSKEKSGPMMGKLIIASALMIALGYPGEVSNDLSTALIWGTLSSIPFAYIIFVLWGELSKATATESPQVNILFRNTRLLLLAT